MRLVPKTEAARARVAHPLAISPGVENGVEVEKASECAAAYSASCFSPQELQDAYFSGPSEQPDAPVSEPQTIALVDAYDDPNAEADLGVYDEEFHLPPCTTANKCFEKVNQGGETGNLHPPQAKKEKEEAEGWALEISTRHRGRPRDLPELSYRAGRDQLGGIRRPRCRRGHGRGPRRHRDLQLLGRRRANASTAQPSIIPASSSQPPPVMRATSTGLRPKKPRKRQKILRRCRLSRSLTPRGRSRRQPA